MGKMVRRYEVFPGRNKFCCNGRFIMAQKTNVFVLTLMLIVGNSILFFAFDGRFLWINLSPALLIVGIILFCYVIAMLLRTAFMDPGILPRATKEEAEATEREINRELAETVGQANRGNPRLKEVVIGGVVYRLKYCVTCKVFRPPRASHCSICDNCVERFDHHCPWVGNCVGKRNYRFFYMFVVSLSVYVVYVFACIIVNIVLISKKEGFVEALKQSPVSVIEAIVCFFSVWSIVGLAGFHTYLVAANQTTNEDIKGTYSSKYNRVGNPFSYGSPCHNICNIVCGPLPTSLLGLREVITVEDRPEPENTTQIQHYAPAYDVTSQPTTAELHHDYGATTVSTIHPSAELNRKPYPTQSYATAQALAAQTSSSHLPNSHHSDANSRSNNINPPPPESASGTVNPDYVRIGVHQPNAKNIPVQTQTSRTIST